MTSVVKEALRKAAIAIAVGCTLFSVNPVLAQTNAVGSIFGSADAAGGKVLVTNTATGATRSANVDASGRFQVTALPPGIYKVELQKDGKTVASRNTSVVVGTGSEISFAAADSQAQELDALTVTAKAGQFDIDVSQTDTRTVFTSAELEKLTLGRQIEEVTLLAPGAVRGDSRYPTQKGASTASFGGAASNENAVYINGYAVTDPVKGLGSSSLPFEGIGQMQLLTGGYGAEFGRSTGGVVNIVTKSGTNQWVAGGLLTYAPESMRGTEPDVRYETVGSARDGTLWRKGGREIDSMTYGAYVGGPIVKDTAFFYLNAEVENRTVDGPRQMGNTSGTATTTGASGWYDRDIDVPRWLAKVDWNIMDGHSLALTAISDINEEKRAYHHYYVLADTRIAGGGTPDPSDDVIVPALTKGPAAGGFDYTEGGELYIARYSGALTDNLVLTALIGTQENAHEEIPFGYSANTIPVRDNRNVASPLSFGSITTLRNPDAYDKSDGFRVDLEYLLSSHSIRVGYDQQNLEIEDGTSVAGPAGYFWFYDTCTEDPIPNSGGATCPGGNSDYVEKTVSATGGVFTTDQYAYFIEDRWQVTDNLLLTMGLRNENFENFNSDGVTFLDQTDQWAPRLGVSWDVYGDSSLRAFANAGRYHLAIPLNLAFRQVGGSTNTSEYFSYTSIDANGIPQGLTALGTGPFSVNQEYGQARDPALAAATSLDAYYQDEIAFGVESKLMPELVGGARFIYRDLGSQIDDNCDPRPGYNWAVQNGYESGVDNADILHGAAGGNGLDDGAEHFASQTASCRIINPGESNTLRLAEEDGDYVTANISAAEWGLPKMKREYKGLDLFIEHPLRNNWYGKLDWTIARSEGNAEGQLLSDIGQADVAVTLNWDHPELMNGADGYLPNDRRHQIKAFGYYQFSPEWRVGATLIALSGRPVSETGFYSGAPLIDVEPTAVGTCDSQCFYENFTDYGGLFYRYTNGVASPRGEAGRLPWTTTIDVGAQYAPNILKNQLKLGIDVFNVFNTIKPQSQLEIFEIGPGAPYHSSGKVISHNAPRFARFMVRYDWGL